MSKKRFANVWDAIEDKLHEHSSSGAVGKPQHRLQMKLRSAVLFYSSEYGPPPARPTVLETGTSALPIQSFLPMSRIPSGDQQQLPLMRSSLSPGAQVMHTPSSNTLKNLNSHSPSSESLS